MMSKMSEPTRVLVVEDEDDWRENIFREALEDQGYQVVTSSSCAEAIAALDQNRFDMIIVDVNLTGVPGNKDGIRVLERMAALGPPPLCIVVSGSPNRAKHEQSVKQFQPITFIDKTEFDVTEFISQVADAFARRANA